MSELTEPQLRALKEIEKMPLGSASTSNFVVLAELATAGLIRIAIDLTDRGREVLADA